MDTIVTIVDTKYKQYIKRTKLLDWKHKLLFHHLQPKTDILTHSSSPHDAIEAKLQRAMERHGHSGHDPNASQHKKFLGDLLDMLRQHEVKVYEKSSHQLKR